MNQLLNRQNDHSDNIKSENSSFDMYVLYFQTKHPKILQ